MVGSPTHGFQCHVGTIPILWSADNITAVKRSKIEEWWLDTCLCTQPYSSDYKRNMHLYCEAHASVLWGKNPSRYLEKRVGSWEDRKENILIVWNWPLFTQYNLSRARTFHSFSHRGFSSLYRVFHVYPMSFCFLIITFFLSFKCHVKASILSSILM